MTEHSIESIRAKLEAVTPQQRETLSFIQWCERYFGTPGYPAPLRLEPWQQELIDHLMDEARKHPVEVLLLKAPRARLTARVTGR